MQHISFLVINELFQVTGTYMFQTFQHSRKGKVVQG